MLPTKISECPLGCHRGECHLSLSVLLKGDLVRKDTNEEKEHLQLVKPRVFETMGVSDEQHDFVSAVSGCFVSACNSADTWIKILCPGVQNDRGNLDFLRQNSPGFSISVPRISSGKCTYL